MMANDRDVDSWIHDRDDFIRPSRFEDSSTSSHQPPHIRSSFGVKSPNNRTVDRNDVSCPTYRLRRSRAKCSRSGPEIRFINPAIYAESLDASNDEEDGDEETIFHGEIPNGEDFVVEVRCGDFCDIVEPLSSLSIADDVDVDDRLSNSGGDLPPAQTYRCSRTKMSRIRNVTNGKSGPARRVVRRCAMKEPSSKLDIGHSAEALTIGNHGFPSEIQRYPANGRKVVQLSSTSLGASSCFVDSQTSGLTLARKLAHEEWIQKKQRAAQLEREIAHRRELERQTEKERIEKEREERERRENENFLKWQERKNQEEMRKRLALERELELQRRLKELEERVAVAKIVHLRKWARKKEEARKAQQREEEFRRSAMERERKKRLEENTKAFKKWRDRAKSKPRPATQGLLPHQRAKPAFVNPEPWQLLVEDSILESQQDSVGIEDEIIEQKDNTRQRIGSRP